MPLPRQIGLMRVHAYNLDHLRAKIVDASNLLDGLSDDARLDQALRYFAEGGTLYGLMEEHNVGRVLEPVCFLQFWKAVATIVGDPSRDKDHQSRHKRLGLPKDYYEHAIEPLHGIRNQFDVAHIASLDAPAFVSMQDIHECREVAAEVIQAYVAVLRGSNLTS